MKKFLLVLMAMSLTFAMISCGDDGGGSDPKDIIITLVAVDGTTSTETIKENTSLGAKLPNPGNGNAWFTDETGGTEVIATTKFSKATTIYARSILPSTPRVTITRSLNYEGAPAGTTVTIDADGTLRANQMNDPAFRPNFLFLGWFMEEAGTTPVVALETTFPENATNTYTIYAKWKADELSPDGDEEGIVEKVTVINAMTTIYRFDLPNGAKWSDYEKVSVDYKLGASTLKAGMARAVRLLGNYRQQDFVFHEGTAAGSAPGKKLALVEFDNFNAAYILANEGGSQTDGNMSSVLETLTGEVPDANTWFTVNYTIDGSKKNASYNDINKPVPDAHGPFYFGIGLPGGPDAANTFLVTNVKLVARSGGDDVIATPAIFDIDGEIYPAFGGYPTTDGTNGYKEAAREIIANDGDFEPIEVSGLEPFRVLLAGKTTENTTPWTTNYNNGFVIPIGSLLPEADWADPEVPEYEVIEVFPWTKVTLDFKYYAYEETDEEDDEGNIIYVKGDELIDVSTLNMNSLVQMKYHAVAVTNANGSNAGTKYNLGDPNDGGGSYQNGAPLSGAAISLPAAGFASGLWGLGIQSGGGGTKDFWGYIEILRIVFHD
jgi:uncharacterized repeat protein (TIGR02543 family)